MDLTDAAESFIVDLSFDGRERGQVLQLRKVGECMLIRLLQPKAADIEPVEQRKTRSHQTKCLSSTPAKVPSSKSTKNQRCEGAAKRSK